jgi:exodeoxyribonuclease-1
MADITLFFYDLETTGVNPRTSRIMQFAGQRTDQQLQPIGEPVNVLIKLTDDTLPEPDAIMITGITPQQTIAEGITEAEFAKLFCTEVATPGTVFVGFNSIRFDDEFMRFFLYRNFYDPYEWQWKDGRGRWDLLDVVRMTRALRPDGINWPFDSAGVPANRLEFLTKVNKLAHENAHDALADVRATIAVAQLIRQKQSKLFDYLFSLRDKKKVAELVTGGQPFVYTSGKYPSEFEKTTVVTTLGPNPDRQGVLVYDLRQDPTPFLAMNPQQLADCWKYTTDPEALRLPVKALQFNRCPAVAPLSVLDSASQKRLKVDMAVITKHRQAVAADADFIIRLADAMQLMNTERQTAFLADEKLVDSQLYDDFIPDADKRLAQSLHAAEPENLAAFAPKFQDIRLQAMLPHYKARNYPKYLTSEEREDWEAYRAKVLLSGGGNSQVARFGSRLATLTAQANLKPDKQYLLEELRLYAESILPEPDEPVVV